MNINYFKISYTLAVNRLITIRIQINGTVHREHFVGYRMCHIKEKDKNHV